MSQHKQAAPGVKLFTIGFFHASVRPRCQAYLHYVQYQREREEGLHVRYDKHTRTVHCSFLSLSRKT